VKIGTRRAKTHTLNFIAQSIQDAVSRVPREPPRLPASPRHGVTEPPAATLWAFTHLMGSAFTRLNET